MKKSIIAVVSGKGGVGKSTIASLVSLALARKNHQTLLIDADIGLTNLDIILKVKSPEFDLDDVVCGRSCLSSAIAKVNKNLDLLSLYKSADIADFDADLSRHYIERAIENYEFVVLDAPAGIESGFELCLQLATRFFIVINPEMPSLSDALKVENIIKHRTTSPYSFIINKARRQEVQTFMKRTKFLDNSVAFCLKDSRNGDRSLLANGAILEYLAKVIINENEQELSI